MGHFGNLAVPIKCEHILYPTDFSELSLTATDYARELANAFGAQLHCLHVVDDGYQYWSALGPESIPAGPPPETLLAMARERIEKFRDEHLTGLNRPPVLEVLLGRPYAEIVGYAREKQIDLIVMATHGRGPVAHMLLGSTTEKVVRKAPCAVLTTRSSAQDFVTPQ